MFSYQTTYLNHNQKTSTQLFSHQRQYHNQATQQLPHSHGSSGKTKLSKATKKKQKKPSKKKQQKNANSSTKWWKQGSVYPEWWIHLWE